MSAYIAEMFKQSQRKTNQSKECKYFHDVYLLNHYIVVIKENAVVNIKILRRHLVVLKEIQNECKHKGEHFTNLLRTRLWCQ